MNIDTMNKQQKVETLGALAEEVVSIYYHNSRMGARLSADKFDSEKDIALGDGSKIEVKVQTRMRCAQAFGINKSRSQIEKCERVDELLFLEYYTEQNEKTDCVTIFKCKDQKAHFSLSDKVRNVERKRFYDIETNMIELATIRLPFHAHLMRKLSTAK
jgi:hypothetical protein